MRFLVISLILGLIPAPVLAGAWPREQGKTFLSFGTTLSAPYDDLGQDQQLFHQLYFERGLARDLTFGLDAGTDMDAAYSVTAFLRRPIKLGFNQDVFALQAGLGVASSGGGTDYLLEFGPSWGRGIDTPLGTGWMSADASAQYNTGLDELGLSADFTVGINPTERSKLILQVQTGQAAGSDPFVRLAPSYVRQFAQGRYLELGAQVGVVGDTRAGVKLGSWLEF